MSGLYGLVRQELWRLATRARVPLLVAVITVAGLATMWGNRGNVAVGPEGRAAMSGPMLLLDAIANLSFYLCLWPVVFGGTLAEDVATNFSAVVLVRAGARARWLASKVLATFVVSGACLFGIGAVWAGAAPLLAPWDASTAPIVVTMADALAAEHPLALAALWLLLLTVASTAVTVGSHLLGVVVRSPFASQVVASVAYLVALLVLPGRFNPGAMASVLSVHAEWATPAWAATYWVAVLGASIALTYAAIRTKEAR